jgi:DNA adenine methylase
MNKIQSKLRTPISYYGGKQRMASTILKYFPSHTTYVEPFFGGGALYFAKQKSEVEVINDTNSELINFYKVCKNQFKKLQKLVRETLHSRSQHDDAYVIYNKPHLFDRIKRAWAVWVLSTQSFSGSLDKSWRYDIKTNGTTKAISNRRDAFLDDLSKRIQLTQIECADAIYIIKSRDSKDTFFYIDPPYYNGNMGHYDGYTFDDFEQLLKTLGQIKGKFLLSSYPSDILEKYRSKFKWNQLSFNQQITACKADKRRGKVEVLTANYHLSEIDTK